MVWALVTGVGSGDVFVLGGVGLCRQVSTPSLWWLWAMALRTSLVKFDRVERTTRFAVRTVAGKCGMRLARTHLRTIGILSFSLVRVSVVVTSLKKASGCLVSNRCSTAARTWQLLPQASSPSKSFVGCLPQGALILLTDTPTLSVRMASLALTLNLVASIGKSPVKCCENM